MIDPYKILGVAKSASSADIRRAFLACAKALHPDAGGNAEDFAKAHKSYEVLMNPEARKKYDAMGIIDSEPEGKRKEQAIQLLKMLFNDLVKQAPAEFIESVDLLKELRKQIIENSDKIKSEHAKKLAEYRKSERALEIVQDRISRKKNIPDIFTDALQESMAAMLTPIAALAENVLLGEEMLKVLNDFNYVFQHHRAILFRFNHGIHPLYSVG